MMVDETKKRTRVILWNYTLWIEKEAHFTFHWHQIHSAIKVMEIQDLISMFVWTRSVKQKNKKKKERKEK